MAVLTEDDGSGTYDNYCQQKVSTLFRSSFDD